MKKITKTTRGERMEQLLKEHTEMCNGRKQFVFKTHSGDEHRECRGTYNSYLTRAITQDLMHLSVFFADIRDNVIETVLRINELDDNLMRIMDDRKAGRNLIKFDYKAVTELIGKMGQIKPDNTQNKEVSDEIRDLLIMSVMRLSYIVKWAVYLETLERIEQFEFDNAIQMFDSEEKYQLAGLTDKEIKDIRFFIGYEKKFLLIYLKADPDSKEENDSYTEALKMELMAKLIAEGKVDEFINKMKQ